MRIGEGISDNLIPIPLNIRADVELTIESCGETVRVHGASAYLELIGEARHVEDFNPMK
jgi:hypothetical protein